MMMMMMMRENSIIIVMTMINIKTNKILIMGLTIMMKEKKGNDGDVYNMLNYDVEKQQQKKQESFGTLTTFGCLLGCRTL
jgi:hypothetical protein